MTKWLMLGTLLSSAAGCSTRYAAMSPTASPSGARFLTFERVSGFVSSGYKLVLLDDGRLEYEGWGLGEKPWPGRSANRASCDGEGSLEPGAPLRAAPRLL